MKRKTNISKQLERKNSQKLIKTILAAKKNSEWRTVAAVLASPRKNFLNLNLQEIDKQTNEGKREIIVIPGKVLSQGELTKKIKIVALNFSERAKEKLLKSGSEVINIIDEIKKNPEGKNLKILGRKNEGNWWNKRGDGSSC